MRLLVSIILTSFFFLTSQDSDAAGKFGFSVGQNKGSGIIENDLSDSSTFADAGSIVFTQVIIRTPSYQYRSVQGIHPDHVRVPVSAYEIVNPADRPTKAFSHCVPIGLKLLFPKHYFW
jgi:hypothetical protein